MAVWTGGILWLCGRVGLVTVVDCVWGGGASVH